MQFKKMMAVVLSFVISCMAFNSNIYAEALESAIEDEIISEYVNASVVSSSLSISSATAECRSNCIGYSYVTRISVTQTLQKFWGMWIWNDVDDASWQDTSTTNEIDISTSKSGLSSGTYRLKSVFTLWTQNGQAETITIYSSEKTIA